MFRKLKAIFITNQNITKKHSGMTLTEVVMASALLIAAIVPILKALTGANLTSNIVEYRTRSLSLAQSKLDEIKARSIYSYGSSFSESDTSLEGSYLCNVSDTGSGSDIRTITVSVGYDKNKDSILSTEEIQITLQSKLSKRW
ncbi:MAG: type IV pilus modification PilV family protein [Planctomycetota bacterium]|jgi:Tfp pilus assembly protein PilV